MKIKFVVMCSPVPERQANVELMKSQIPDLIVKNCGIDTLWETFINCFDIEDEYDGLVLLEDDVQLCKNFYQRITEVIEGNKNIVVSFFEKPLSKKTLTTKICKGSDFFCGLCNYFPKSICDGLKQKQNVEDFKVWFAKRNEKWTYPNDIYIAFVLGRYKLSYLMKVPFLVQHKDFKSALGSRSTKRQTKFFIDDME